MQISSARTLILDKLRAQNVNEAENQVVATHILGNIYQFYRTHPDQRDWSVADVIREIPVEELIEGCEA